jgi:prepilin-type processing-associated H-X9-DG protein
MATLMCPSESMTAPTQTAGWKNYVGNLGGPSPIASYSGTIVPMNNGPLGATTAYTPNPPVGCPTCTTVGIQSITDGTSNTAMFSECLLGTNPVANQVTLGSTKRGATYLFQAGQSAPFDQGATGYASALTFVNACKNLPGSTPGFGALGGGSGNNWIAGNAGSCVIWDGYNHWMAPNTFGCDNGVDGNTGGWATDADAVPPSSNHPGGVNVGMADGSVKFIKNTVGVQAWWALGTRAGGEVISSDAY